MNDIMTYSLEQIQQGLQKARKEQDGFNDHLRILFSPNNIGDHNFEQVCDIYGRVDPANYETVIIIEEHEEVLAKKLPMASNLFFETPLGNVPANDYMRNEFCDEDDDFFIYDEAFSKDMSLFPQLMMAQGVFGDNFKALSVQIADERQSIIKELTHVLEEVLASRSALLVFCCDLQRNRQEEFDRLCKMIEDHNHSQMLNYLNSGESHITGPSAFIAGILVAHKWGMRLNFVSEEADHSLLTAYADREHVVY